MSCGRKKVFARVSPTLRAAVADAAHRRGVDHSTVVRDALAAYLQPQRAPASDQPTTTPQTMLPSLLQTLDAATRAQLTEGMARFQASPLALVSAILRQWAASMKDPRLWRVWRP